MDATTRLSCLTFPVIVKPAWEGSSKGIRGKCVVDNARWNWPRPSSRSAAIIASRSWSEEYIEGDELTVGVLGNDEPRVIGVMRVVPLRPTERSSTAWK